MSGGGGLVVVIITNVAAHISSSYVVDPVWVVLALMMVHAIYSG